MKSLGYCSEGRGLGLAKESSHVGSIPARSGHSSRHQERRAFGEIIVANK
jgi:hypothetical protein